MPREAFLPGSGLVAAYADEPIVIKRDSDDVPISSSSQPSMMAIMLEQLEPAPGHRVLEIGTGTGYNAALLAELVGDRGLVVSVDIDQDLVEGARENLVRAGYSGVRVVCADGAGIPARSALRSHHRDRRCPRPSPRLVRATRPRWSTGGTAGHERFATQHRIRAKR